MEYLKDIFTDEIIAYFLQLVFLALATGLGLLFKAAIAYLKQKIGIDKLDAFMAQVEITVSFLEQFGINIGLGNGLQKKEYAVNVLAAKADNMGLDISYNEIGVLVEAFVLAVKD
jgi:hypothetical protein